MSQISILKFLYKQSPINFYKITQDGNTIIKSINNTNLGYEFNKVFTTEEISKIWKSIHTHRRISTIIIFLLFIFTMYNYIFPNFAVFAKNSWEVNAISLIALTAIIYKIAISIISKFFELKLKKDFGEYKKTLFSNPDNLDEHYFKLFKIELIKIAIVLGIFALSLSLISPVKIIQNNIENENYLRAINLANTGAAIFPILPDWYAMRGYAKFHTQDYQGAINDYDKAFRLEFDRYNVMNFDNKIFIKYYIKDYKSALDDFDNEIKNTNNSYDKDAFLWDKAQFLYNIKRYNEALSIYTELLSKADEDRVFLLKDRLYIERAQVYQALGQNELAQNDLILAGSNENSYEPIKSIPEPTLLFDND